MLTWVPEEETCSQPCVDRDEVGERAAEDGDLEPVVELPEGVEVAEAALPHLQQLPQQHGHSCRQSEGSLGAMIRGVWVVATGNSVDWGKESRLGPVFELMLRPVFRSKTLAATQWRPSTTTNVISLYRLQSIRSMCVYDRLRTSRYGCM